MLSFISPVVRLPGGAPGPGAVPEGWRDAGKVREGCGSSPDPAGSSAPSPPGASSLPRGREWAVEMRKNKIKIK